MQTEGKLQIVDFLTNLMPHVPFQSPRANHKQDNQSIIWANLGDIQANLSDSQANWSAEFHCNWLEESCLLSALNNE